MRPVAGPCSGHGLSCLEAVGERVVVVPGSPHVFRARWGKQRATVRSQEAI
jgi:hypothetical protein